MIHVEDILGVALLEPNAIYYSDSKYMQGYYQALRDACDYLYKKNDETLKNMAMDLPKFGDEGR